MIRTSLFFQKPFEVEATEEEIQPPGPDHVLVYTRFSAISAGTELLVYRGLLPSDMEQDVNIPSLAGTFAYPLKYGYATVGKVAATGADVDPTWNDRMVFCFHPHESAFLADPSELIALPESVDPLDALFLPNMETAVNFVMDGAPMIGERVVVLGLGIVGLLTTALLTRFPLSLLIGVDRYARRREIALELGVDAAFDAHIREHVIHVKNFLLKISSDSSVDLIYEISGNPQAVNSAIALAGFDARVILGSWYGQKMTEIDLGGTFHRSRIRLISSQVSTLAPVLSGRWTKARRLALAFDLLRQIHPARFITHSFPLERADQAYKLLDTQPENVLQVIFRYENPAAR